MYQNRRSRRRFREKFEWRGSGRIACYALRNPVYADALARRAKIKASGGIATRQQAIDLLEAGAELLGASAAPAIVDRALAARTEY